MHRSSLVFLLLASLSCSSNELGRIGKSSSKDKPSTTDPAVTDDKDKDTPEGGIESDAVKTIKDGLANTAALVSIPNATMTDFWNGRAVFKLVRADTAHAVADGNKISFVTMPSGKWYAFARQDTTLGVRSSDDQGATWSAMTTVATPPSGTTLLVDQDAYYDAETTRWYLVTQCNTAAGWRMCAFTRDGADPVGPFTAVKDGPIFKSGYLFQDGGICGGGHCPATTAEEGTPDVMFKLNGLFYLTFHGFDGVRGYRGVAATTDFNVGWRIDGGVGLAKDVMLGPGDCAQWHPGCIGIADTTTLIDDGYIYTLAESADINLVCSPNQTWMSALVRSKGALAPTGQWEMFPRNPVANTGASATPCKMNYQKMFRDQKTGFIYLTYWWHNGTTYELRYYRLEPGNGLGGALVPPANAANGSQPATTPTEPTPEQLAAAAAAAAATVPAPPADIGHFQLAGILAKNNGGYANCHTSLMTNNGTNRPGVAPIPNIWATPCYATFGAAPDCACPASSHWEVVGGHYADGCGAMAPGLQAQGLNVDDTSWDCCMIEFKCMQ